VDTSLNRVSPLLGHIVCRRITTTEVGKIVAVDARESSLHGGLPGVTVKWNNGVQIIEPAAHLLSFERVIEAKAKRVEEGRALIARMKTGDVEVDPVAAGIRALDPVSATVLHQIVER